MLRLWALCASNISSNPRKLKGTPLMESEEVWIHEKLKINDIDRRVMRMPNTKRYEYTLVSIIAVLPNHGWGSK